MADRDASGPDEATDAPAARDFVACARSLLAHGMPMPDEDRYTFSAELTAFLGEQCAGAM